MSASVQFDLHLGDSFGASSNQGSEYILMRYASKPKIDTSTAKDTNFIRNAEGRYLVSVNNDENEQAAYEGTENTTQDMDCLLIYDEETKSFTLERSQIMLSMRKARKSQIAEMKQAFQAESMGRDNNDGVNASDDDFEMDISKEMEELLEEDDDDEDANTIPDTNMEEVKAPAQENPKKTSEVSADTMTEFNPVSPVTRPEIKSTASSPKVADRRRKPILASTPIRRPLTSSSLPSSPAKPLTNMSLPNTNTFTNKSQRQSAASSSGSSSGSSDSGSSSSGSEDDDSSSGSDSDDDDFANLAENISQSLDSSEPAQPTTRPTLQALPQHGTADKPRSLRAFLDGEDEPMADDDAITSSSDSE
ncbi:hypothetical protein NQZ79_g1009 [Umbelopsis isabellina]|nr:hypothetical protein NQZ79_g1009 [Umbelopsis isabellina]